MILRLRLLLADAIENWRLGIIVAAMVSVLLTLGLMIRAPFVAELKIDVGGITTEANYGLVRFMPFEDADKIERFFSHHASVNSPFNAEYNCSAKAIYPPDGLQLKLLCRVRAENKIHEIILFALKPLLDRHANLYALAEKYYGGRLDLIEREIRDRERIVELLRKPPTSNLSETQLIGQQIIIEKLRESQAFERLLGSRIRPTRFDKGSISVVNRQPGLKEWVVVLLLSLGSGLFVAAFSTRLKRIEA